MKRLQTRRAPRHQRAQRRHQPISTRNTTKKAWPSIAAPERTAAKASGVRKQHVMELKKTDLPVGWLEIVPENFMNFGGFPQAMLDHCASRWPIVSHGVNLSIGSVDPLNEEYVDRLKTVLERTRALWYSDHLCFTSVGGEYFHDLLPLPFSNEAADHVVSGVKQLKKKIPLPFLLENPS